MPAEECNNALVHMIAHNLRRDARTHARPERVLMLAGYIIRSQPMPEDVRRAVEKVGDAPYRAVLP